MSSLWAEYHGMDIRRENKSRVGFAVEEKVEFMFRVSQYNAL